MAAATRIARRQKGRIVQWYRHRQTLKVLAKLDAHMLKDIGLTSSGSVYAAAKERSRQAAANENSRSEAA